jgi:hypothetical protein
MTLSDDLREIEERAAKASPAPWQWSVTELDDRLMDATGALVLTDGSACGEYVSDIEADSPDGRFIAAARMDVPVLVEMVKMLTADFITTGEDEGFRRVREEIEEMWSEAKRKVEKITTPRR